MNLRRAASALVPAAGLLLAACAGGAAASSQTGSKDAKDRGEELLAAGDFDGAVHAFESQGAEQGSPEAREKLLTAKVRAASAHAQSAMRAAESGDDDRARGELARADGYAPDLPAVREAHAAIDGRIETAQKAAAMRERARSLVASNPAEAERLFADAQAVAPEKPDAAAGTAKLRREAVLRAEADRCADRAAAAWAAHERERTVRELEGARFGGVPVPKASALRRVIEEALVADASRADEAALRSAAEFAEDAGLHATVVRTLRDRLVDKLLASAQNLRETRRTATAALLETEAKRLRPNAKTPSLDRIRELVTVTILVAPFTDDTGGRIDGVQLGQALRERLTLDALGGGQPLRALDDSPDARKSYADALVLTGRVLTARESGGRIGRENKKIHYQSGSTRRPNPEFDELVTKIGAAASATRVAEEEQKNAADWLNSVRAMGVTGGMPRTGDVAYETKLAAATSRANRADDAVKYAHETETALRQQVASTPREIEEPIWSDYILVVTTSQRTAQITARIDLVAGDRTLLSQDFTAAAQHKETVSDGFAPAGLEVDPDETPDDATMAADAADRFAAMAAGRVRAAAEGAAETYLTAARAAEREGRRDDAAESYAMYLLATPDAASPERAAAAKGLEDLLGVHVVLRTAPRKEHP